jgi:glutamate synthase (NADPH/NADH) small chain
MGLTDFIHIQRADPTRRPVAERTRDWRELYEPSSEETLRAQGGRCMDCGVPFCQGDTGCPVQNVIPEWNALVRGNRWRDAAAALHATNNFPEFTGRLCPAPCESACVLGVIEQPVAIRSIEQAIADKAIGEGWVVPQPPVHETGLRVAVVGSGPAGLAAAQQLRRAGHGVAVFEKSDRVGGLLRYGIPDFKMDKAVLDARVRQIVDEGVAFETGVDVGVDIPVDTLRAEFDAVLLAGGAMQARELRVPGRELRGVHLAMDFLSQQNRRVAGETIDAESAIWAGGKRVVVIGGGDTGSDCVGTCHRQGATVVHQIEVLPRPPIERDASTPWPLWPHRLRTTHAHEEGCVRDWSISTTNLTGADGRVTALHGSRGAAAGASEAEEFRLDVDLVLLAMGFTGPVREGLLTDLGVAVTPRGAVATDAKHMTNVEGVFAAGDMRRGASLIVWAIREGRDAARAIDQYLAGKATGRADRDDRRILAAP